MDGQTVAVRGPKRQALLAYLAYNAGTPVGREELINLLWGDRFDDQARRSLRQSLLRLRRDLDMAGVSPLEIEADTVLFRSDAAKIDAVDFRALAGSEDLAVLGCAAGLHDQLLNGLVTRQEGFNIWLAGERAALLQQLMTMLSRLSTELMERAGSRSWTSASALIFSKPRRTGAVDSRQLCQADRAMAPAPATDTKINKSGLKMSLSQTAAAAASSMGAK